MIDLQDMNFIKRYLSILFVIFLAACGYEPEPGPLNNLGGVERNACYEEYGEFYNTTTFNDFIENAEDTSGAVTYPLVMEAYSYMIATEQGSIVRITDNEHVWTARLESEEVVAAGMCADIDKNIYAVTLDGLVHSYSYDGKLRWKHRMDIDTTRAVIFSHLLAVPEGIAAASSDGLIEFLDHDGNIKWSRRSEWNATGMFAADDNYDLLIALTYNQFGASDSLLCIDQDGNEKWKSGFEKIRLLGSPVFNNGKIYIRGMGEAGSRGPSYIIALDTNGNELWQRKMPVVPRHMSASEKRNEIYVTGYDAGLGQALSGIHCFDDEGNQKWQIYLEATIPAPVLVGEKFLAVIGITPEAAGVYFLNKSGTLIKSIGLPVWPPARLKPIVNYNGSILFAGSQNLSFIRIDDYPMDKILP